MTYVVLDTDVASNLVRDRLPPAFLSRLATAVPCLTFVSVGELTEWEIIRGWGSKSVDRLRRWVSSVPVLGYDAEVARTWGRMSAVGRRAGRRSPTNDMWIAACCVTEGLPLATMNARDYEYLSEHHGLDLVTDPR
ncbi:MAG: type II toxin-antitoxin system VapC family toxin [Kineosporiaceae bacterium]